MIIADSNVWIDYLNRSDSPSGESLSELLKAQRIVLTGQVLAEVLQGAHDIEEFDRLASLMDGVPYIETTRKTWIKAATISARLRANGQLIPLSDVIIAAVAIEEGHEVFSRDHHFQRVPGLRVYEARAV